MLIYDIGANVGNYALSNINNNILCIEASPITFNKLLKNVSKYPNILSLNYAVTNIDVDNIIFYHCNTDTISSLDYEWLSSCDSRFGNYKNQVTPILVPAISLDKLIEKYGLPDLIKVDVEGAEYSVIKSLTKKVDILCFEWASEWKEKYINTINYLVTLGYSKFHIQNKDEYTYKPKEYELTKDEVISYIDNSVKKIDWGMIWCI
jgi:FkbM family methyltransferase